MNYILLFLVFVITNVYSQQAMFHAHNATACDGGRQTAGCGGQTTMTDARDSKVYNIVQTGTGAGIQCWMAQNLNYGTYAAITTPQVAGTKFCQNLSGVNDAACPFGGLYEWTNMMNGSTTCNGDATCPPCATPVQGLCPAGWHVPSHYEWTTLEKNVGTNPGAFPYDVSTTGWLGTDEGGNLKQTGTTNWTTPNTGATNTSGFLALPGGTSWAGSFTNVGYYGNWWSATESGGNAWRRSLGYTEARVARYTINKVYGYSVRCVKDCSAGTASAGTDINPACGFTTATLVGNTPSEGTGQWSVVSGTATITTSSSPTSGVTGLAIPDTVTLRWTISNTPCTSMDDVVITTTACACTYNSSYVTGNINHTIGTVSPETKTVNYGQVQTSISGASKCWITQNLGSTNQASSATDATDASAGWYWQFNRKQGYKVGPTPAWTITSISETSDWISAEDPCTIELGAGWRIPTYTEWQNADGAPQNWGSYTDTYNSVLKLHTGGYLIENNGTLSLRGGQGFFWFSTQLAATTGRCLSTYSAGSDMNNGLKAQGKSLRCLRDFVCGDPFVINHTIGTVAPETKAVNYGTVTSSISGASKCWITQNLGADNQASSATDATDASAGWYWQYNRKQGYKVGPTPSWTITSISDTSDWVAAQDPCTIELGAGWRIPTYTEWLNADGAPQNWANYTDTYNSVLKIHAAGDLATGSGTLEARGTTGFYWSSTQQNPGGGWGLYANSGNSFMASVNKAYGLPLRCLKD